MSMYRLDQSHVASAQRIPVGSLLVSGVITAAASYVALTDHIRHENGLPFEGGIIVAVLMTGLYSVSIRNAIVKRPRLAEALRHHALSIEGGCLRFLNAGVESTLELAQVQRVLVQRAGAKIVSLVLEMESGAKVKLEHYERMEQMLGELSSSTPRVQERSWWHFHF